MNYSPFSVFVFIGFSIMMRIILSRMISIRYYQKPTVVQIEGNIGAGKTTLLNMLNTDLCEDAEFIREPVETWTNVVDEDKKNILEKFMKDKTRWAFTFHILGFETRMELLLKSIKNTIKPFIFLDRSPMSDTKTFAPMLHKDGYLDALEYRTYLMLNGFFDNHINDFISGRKIIYLRTQPEVAFERIKKRARSEEELMDYDYITKLHQKHDDWLLDNDEENVLIIDGDYDFENNKEDYQFILDKTREFIYSKN